ncbi:hypothetical protein KC19_VG009800 [Ceratodon purpureus]|uniref:Uncharacterized protein n=1 Tax=Ceratodon purpureus TaxID=3225 RepID=A0A8T0HKY4_CERPU|nr:hypothetical protein KC19_VG009800 [Ceratodon purpureus]
MGTHNVVTSYGVKSERRDRYDGESSWIESVIREYELGILGPKHNCQGYCGCTSCARLAWIENPICRCSYNGYLPRSLSLDDAMRQKWSRCRCSPTRFSAVCDTTCICLLMLPTQECVESPISGYSLPSDLLQNSSPRAEMQSPFTQRGDDTVMRIVDRLEEEGRRFTEKGFSSHGTEIIVNEGTTVLLSDIQGKKRARAEENHNGTESEMDDTACSKVVH